MQLYLMRHGLAYSEKEDPLCVLSPEGIDQVKSVGRALRSLSLRFDLILASPKRRAQQTAALIAESVRYPYSDIVSTESALPNAHPSALIRLLEPEPDDSRILVVGHLPHLADLLCELCGGGKFKLGNADLACVERVQQASTLTSLLPNSYLALLAATR
ncbi:MAG: phosphohistidine phosphatase SixA [Deltaproteobacteria bacterium]|jgi:phosphohistidine phosphatase|nr:phosphohistidine phosphatase SixA [Deltaproteobacteria bacterium]MBW2518826.1 phosphohistidine phosphatase SixA [Deltaproteobacteria bacterium]